MPNTENIIIIGGGPAGLSAAIYNARANLKPLVFAGSPPGGQLTLTTEVENFPGIESIQGPDLIINMRKHAEKFGTRILDQNITKVDFSASPFTVHTYEADKGDSVDGGAGRNKGNTGVFKAKSILIATGAKALWLGLESETRLRGKGVSACATCDAFFFRNKVVAVIGGGDTAMEEALTLTKFASKVYLIHRRDTFRASRIMVERVHNNPKIEMVVNSSVSEIMGAVKVEGIQLASVVTGEPRTIKLDGVFIAIGHKPDTELFKDQITLDKKGYIMTAERQWIERGQAVAIEPSESQMTSHKFHAMTSVEGVFAAGDCVDYLYRQAITAAGMGVAAALEAERWLETV